MKLLCRILGHHLDAVYFKADAGFLTYIQIECTRCGASGFGWKQLAPQPPTLESITKLLDAGSITVEQFRRWFDCWSKPQGFYPSLHDTERWAHEFFSRENRFR